MVPRSMREVRGGALKVGSLMDDDQDPAVGQTDKNHFNCNAVKLVLVGETLTNNHPVVPSVSRILC